MPEWCVYMLRCRDGSLYTGATNDLDSRLQVHRTGRGAAYTRSRLPVFLVYAEAASDKSAARREWALKQLSRPEKVALLKRRRAGSPVRAAGPSASALRPGRVKARRRRTRR